MMVVFLYEKHRNVTVRMADGGLSWSRGTAKEGKEEGGEGEGEEVGGGRAWNFLEKGDGS